NARSTGAVNSSRFDLRQDCVLDTLPHGGNLSRVTTRQSLLGDLRCLAQTHDAGDVFRPSPPRALVTSAVQHGPELRSLSHVESAHALRPVHLVSGDGEQITADFLHIDRHFPRRLHRVTVKVDISICGHPGDLLY